MHNLINNIYIFDSLFNGIWKSIKMISLFFSLTYLALEKQLALPIKRCLT